MNRVPALLCAWLLASPLLPAAEAPVAVPASSPEMAEIFRADQADRQPGKAIDWTVVNQRDEARRLLVRRLLDEGRLTTAADFSQAAFVYQHGNKPEDYLLAHVLAMAAQRLGSTEASWIAAATLDRFLVNSGKPQILGTQFQGPAGGALTQEPYDTQLVPDSLRTVLGVPTREQQKVQMKELEQRNKQR